MLDPGLHNRVLVSIPQPFDRDHRLAGDLADMRLTGTHSLAVDLNGAGATLRYPAAVLGTCDTELVPQHPKQRHVRNHVNLMPGPIDRELDHVDASFRGSSRPHFQSGQEFDAYFAAVAAFSINAATSRACERKIA